VRLITWETDKYYHVVVQFGIPKEQFEDGRKANRAAGRDSEIPPIAWWIVAVASRWPTWFERDHAAIAYSRSLHHEECAALT
jgi:hypothetical protein